MNFKDLHMFKIQEKNCRTTMNTGMHADIIGHRIHIYSADKSMFVVSELSEVNYLE